MKTIASVTHNCMEDFCKCSLGWTWGFSIRKNIKHREMIITIKNNFNYKTKQSAEKALVNFMLKHNFNCDTLGYGEIVN